MELAITPRHGGTPAYKAVVVVKLLICMINASKGECLIGELRVINDFNLGCLVLCVILAVSVTDARRCC